MDIFEFELRYRAYSGLLAFFGEEVKDDTLLSLIQRTDLGVLSTKLIDTSLEQLREATRQTYTEEKKNILSAYADKIHKEKTKAEYLERLEYELKVIHEMGYNTYFLVVRDYIHWARSSSIMVGPGRGSVAGSVLSFVLGITDLDPLEYDLIFERFLNPGRISMPDIDTDFEDTSRDQVIDYIKQKYGEENVAHIGTYMTLAAKAAFKDVARVLGLKFDQANKLSGFITGKTIEESLKENKDLQEAMKNETRLEKIIQIATALEGTVRQIGVHACGMIIAPAPVVTFSPVQFPPKSGSKELRDETRIVSQYEGPIVEYIGLLKMDILGLRNLNIIKHTAKIIQARMRREGNELPELIELILTTMKFHPPLDDPKAYKVFADGDTTGVFQFESDGMRSWLKKLKPNRFDDLIAMVALYRPGPIEFIPQYVDRKHGVQQINYMHTDLEDLLLQNYGQQTVEDEKQKLIEDLSPFLEVTYGIAVYQEQLMRLVQAMADFSMPEADNLRKGVGKKIREVIEKIKVEFVKRAVSFREYKPETATWIYEKMIEPAADYSFNKSHAACYAYISYQTAWLKAHYPLEFHAALLRSVEQETDKFASGIQEIQLQGMEIKPPSVASSFEHVAAIDDHLEIGFLGIKGIGTEVAQFLEQERIRGPYASLGDFLRRNSSIINKKTLESLVKSGALDLFGSREQLLISVPQMLEWTKQQSAAGGGLFGGGFFDAEEFTLPATSTPPDPSTLLRMEKEVFNVAISGHPFDGLYTRCKQKYNFISAINVENYGEFHLCVVVVGMSKGMRGGYFLQVEDISGQLEFYMLEKIDVEPFDILLITGYKGQRFPRIETVRVVALTDLIQKAKTGGVYDPALTVAKARVLRQQEGAQTASLSSTTKQEPVVIQDESPETEALVPEAVVDTLEAPAGALSFELPDDAALLKELLAYVKKYPGKYELHLGPKKVSVSPEGVEKIQTFLRTHVKN